MQRSRSSQPRLRAFARCSRHTAFTILLCHAGQDLDTDAIARRRVKPQVDPDTRFKTFATVEEAERYQGPDGPRGW